jgi:hypothetical protein
MPTCTKYQSERSFYPSGASQAAAPLVWLYRSELQLSQWSFQAKSTCSDVVTWAGSKNYSSSFNFVQNGNKGEQNQTARCTWQRQSLRLHKRPYNNTVRGARLCIGLGTRCNSSSNIYVLLLHIHKTPCLRPSRNAQKMPCLTLRHPGRCFVLRPYPALRHCSHG